MKKGMLHIVISCLASAALLLAALSGAGCSFLYKSGQSPAYIKNKQYNEIVDQQSDIINSSEPAAKIAEAYIQRGEAYTCLKEYRYAYRDLQIAWKLSCYIYQAGPEETDSEKQTFNATSACLERLPVLIDELKPFVSEFGAIMSTRNASQIVKEKFPDSYR